MTSRKTSCDTSVLINFFKINRLDLLEKSSHSFFITEHVQEEITTGYSNQYSLLQAALNKKILQKTDVESAEEFTLFAELSNSRQLGIGESAAIANRELSRILFVD